jgi:hypothetical protein
MIYERVTKARFEPLRALLAKELRIPFVFSRTFTRADLEPGSEPLTLFASAPDGGHVRIVSANQDYLMAGVDAVDALIYRDDRDTRPQRCYGYTVWDTLVGDLGESLGIVPSSRLADRARERWEEVRAVAAEVIRGTPCLRPPAAYATHVFEVAEAIIAEGERRRERYRDECARPPAATFTATCSGCRREWRDDAEGYAAHRETGCGTLRTSLTPEIAPEKVDF